LGGALEGRELVSVADIAEAPLRVEERVKKVPDGAGGLVDQSIRFPVWLDPVFGGLTPMVEAFMRAETALTYWVGEHPDSFPPVVIHFTDGESTDGDPTAAAERIKQLTTHDGNVLLFNCHISSRGGISVMFPDSEEGLPDDYARLLFRISSVLPETFRRVLSEMNYLPSPGTRGFVYQARAETVLQFLDIGTQTRHLALGPADASADR
jgi:hypothetical protein